MSNVLAGIGRGQLEVLDERVRQRRAVAFRYREAFRDVPGITLMPQAQYGLHTNWLSCFLVDRAEFGASRDDVLRALSARDIEARPLWKPMHLQPVFAKFECVGGSVAADLFDKGLCLPSGTAMKRDDLERIAGVIRESWGG